MRRCCKGEISPLRRYAPPVEMTRGGRIGSGRNDRGPYSARNDRGRLHSQKAGRMACSFVPAWHISISTIDNRGSLRRKYTFGARFEVTAGEETRLGSAECPKSNKISPILSKTYVCGRCEVPQTKNIATHACRMCPRRKTLPGPLRHGALYLAFSRTTRPFRARPALYASTRRAWCSQLMSKCVACKGSPSI